MYKDINRKISKFLKTFLKKIQPRFSFHYVAYSVLFFAIIFSFVNLVTATTPNPGHPWSELGDGVFSFSNGQTATAYTYTYPAANSTVLTTNAAVTVAQGGTGLGSISDKTILVTNGANSLTALVIPAGQSVRRNAGDTAFEAFTPGTVTAVSVATANGISGSSSGGTTPSLTISLGAITPSTVNGLTLTSQTTGFTIAGGTTSKTLTVGLDASVSGTNTGDQTKIANLIGGNSTTLLGALPYQSNTDTTSLLSPNVSSTKNFLTMTGTGTNGAAPAWGTIAQADVSGLTTASSPTFGGATLNGNLVMGTNSITSTGSLGATGARLTAGFFTDLTVTNAISGTIATATNANNTAITEDTSAASAVYPTWVTGNTGNLAQKTTSTKLSFIPSTGVLSATGFAGAGTGLTGTASSLTAGSVTNATLTTSLTNNGGAGTLTWPAAGATLTIPTGGGTLGTAAFTAATAYQASNTNLNSLAGLAYASASFVKMTGANTFTLDTNTYVTTAGNAASATKSTNLSGGNSTTLLGALPYQSNTDTTSLLSPNVSSTKNFLTMTGTGTNGAAPAWGTIAQADVSGLTTASSPTFGGATLNGNLVMGTNSITSTGSLGATGARLTAGFFTDLTVTNAISGTIATATNANNTAITEDTSAASAVYPTWVTGNTGNLAQKTTSTKLSFIPSTGVLSATGFAGPLTGTASKASALVGGNNTTLLGAIHYQSNTDVTSLLSPNTTTGIKYLSMTGDGTNGAAPVWSTISGGGDMVLASVQTVTGAKTFNDTKFFLRNVANTFNASFVNTNTADRIYTLPDYAGTLATLAGNEALTNKSINGVTLSTSAGAAVFLAGDGTYKAAGGSVTADSLNFTELSDSLVLDASTSIAFGASTFGLTFTNNGSANELHNLTSTGNFVVQDNGVDAFTVDNTGFVSLGQSSSLTGKLTFENASNTNTVTLQSGATAGNYTWTLPTAAPSAGCLQSDGSGNLSVATCGDVNNQSWTANGNWTIPTGALMVIVETYGGGGGGGGGAGASNLTTSHSGGGGGGGGAYVHGTFSGVSLGTPGSTIIPITVGTAGTGGNGAANASGVAGGPGGMSCFGTVSGCASGVVYIKSYGGGGGAPGSVTNATGAGGGGGGGSLAQGNNSASGTGGVGGAPLAGPVNTANSGGGGGGGATSLGTAVNGGAAQFGGAGGGASSLNGAAAGGAGGGSVYGGSGGGAGGSIAVTTYTLRAGGAGGTGSAISASGGAGGAANGSAGTIGSNGMGGGGDGGGGGATNSTGVGGAGGNGGVRGGGGGGGGASGTGITGGKGGAGGVGYVRIWTYRGTGADLAEIYGTYDSSIEAGDVVAIDETMNAGVKKTSKIYERGTIGVISTQPGLIIGSVEDPNARPVMVALSGRVPMKVNLENGPIKKGDYLTASSTLGSAMRATKAGVVIGQAMTEYSDPTTPGYVVAFIKSGPSNGSSIEGMLPDGLTLLSDGTATTNINETPIPEKSLQQRILAYLNENKLILEQSNNLSEVTSDRVTAGLEIITPALYAINVSTDNIHSSLSDTIIFGSKAKFVVPPLFNKDTAGFAVIKQGDIRVKVTYENPYIGEPSVSASLVFNVADKISDALASNLFDNNVESIIVDNSESGFTILLNKNAPRDLRFSWNSFAVEDPKVFESVIDGLTIEPEKVTIPESSMPKVDNTETPIVNTPTIDTLLTPEINIPVTTETVPSVDTTNPSVNEPIINLPEISTSNLPATDIPLVDTPTLPEVISSN